MDLPDGIRALATGGLDFEEGRPGPPSVEDKLEQVETERPTST